VIFEHLVVGPFQCNCFILGCSETRQALVVDPGDQLPAITERLARHGLTVSAIVATHAHLDHVGALSGLGAATGAPTCLCTGTTSSSTTTWPCRQPCSGSPRPPRGPSPGT